VSSAVSEPLNPFTTNLRRLRKERGLTQEQLAERVGMEQGYYSRIERGRVTPSIRTALKLAGALDVEMNVLLPREPPWV
jgi:XRE family transcriptional regulator, regulator of sulfur utilization